MWSYRKKAPGKSGPPVTEPHRPAPVSEPFAGFGTRLSRLMSNTNSISSVKSNVPLVRNSSLASVFLLTKRAMCPEEQDRSHSRGRQETFHSTGRGGAGNIRPASQSRADTTVETHPDGPDDFSSTRGREMNVTPKLTHSGRGGAGNIRSPSRGPGLGAGPTSPTLDQREIDVLRRAAAEREAELPHSSGRGGAGNIFTSRSRSRSQARGETGPGGAGAFRSSGRGGVGNIMADGHGIDENREDEMERKAHHHVDAGIHSTGRGGSANFTTSQQPAVEHTAHAHGAHETASSGRGGAGNIREASRAREASRTRDANTDNK